MSIKNMKITSTYFLNLTTADILELLKLKDPDKYKDVEIEIAVVVHPDEIEIYPDDPTGLFFLPKCAPLSVKVSEI